MKTRKNYKKGGSSSTASADSNVWENWKTNNPEIMSAYDNAKSTKGSLSIGVIGGLLTAGLFGLVIYNKAN